jgi:hypothetical protein
MRHRERLQQKLLRGLRVAAWGRQQNLALHAQQLREIVCAAPLLCPRQSCVDRGYRFRVVACSGETFSKRQENIDQKRKCCSVEG